MRHWLGLTLFLLATAAFAAPKKPVVLVTGPAPATKLLSKALSKKFTPKPLAALAPMPTAKEVRDVTAPAGAIAVVSVQAAGAYLTIQVLSGHDGTPLDTLTIKGTAKKPPKALAKPDLASLLFAVAQGKAPGAAKAPEAPVAEAKPEPTPEPAKKTPAPEPAKKELAAAKKKAPEPAPKEEPRPEPAPAVSDAPEDEPAPAPSEHPALRLSVGAGGFNRGFSWAGNPSPSLATSSQPFAATVAVDGTWFPGAHFTSSFLANLGVTASGEFGLGMASRVNTSRFANHASRLRLGAVVRVPLGSRFELSGHAGYARHELGTSTTAVNDGAVRPNIPDVTFTGFRGGLGLRLRLFGTVELDAQGSFNAIGGLGELGSERYFPNARALAVDAGGGLSVELATNLRLRGGAEWQRYFVTLNAAEEDTFFARTAADQYLAASVQLQWVM